MTAPADPLVIAGRTFGSRLILGTGKYPSHEVMQAAHRAGGTEMVTVAVRRVDITRTSASLLDFIDTDAITRLPNTAACYTADDAIRTAHLGREAGMSHWVKLEVIGDERTLLPDELFRADEAFITSSLKETLPLRAVDGRPIGPGKPGPVTRRLLAVFREYAPRHSR